MVINILLLSNINRLYSFSFLSGLLYPSTNPILTTMDTMRNIPSAIEVLYHLTVMMLTLGQGVHPMPVTTEVPMCSASESAQYSLTFTGKWTHAAFPKQYPVYRPPAQWSNLIGKCISLDGCLTES